jgi:hypothetical protein
MQLDHNLNYKRDLRNIKQNTARRTELQICRFARIWTSTISINASDVKVIRAQWHLRDLSVLIGDNFIKEDF